ncbi:MAG TPA: hypothetical protein VH143_07395 [Kofleriaceae bacterium]|jgi:hypothetical protein|nr:hypothetical protein [Kofleriaceae bacterium]
MQQHLFDLTALGLAGAGVIALLSALAKTAWWLPLKAPLGIGIAALAVVDFAWMLPALRHIETDNSMNDVAIGVQMSVLIVAAGLGALFVTQLLAKVRSSDNVEGLALIGSSYQVLGGIVALAASGAYVLLRMHLLDWAM